MVYTRIAGVWVSGTVVSATGSILSIRLVTGTTVWRDESEVTTESPRLSDSSEWPV